MLNTNPFSDKYMNKKSETSIVVVVVVKYNRKIYLIIL